MRLHPASWCNSSGAEHAGLERSGVAFQRGQVVLVGAHANVAVGANGEECASFDPQGEASADSR